MKNINKPIVIIDYGMGNLGSIANMLKKIGERCIVTSKTADIKDAKKIILPGVGAFDNGIGNLEKMGIIPVLNRKVIKEKAYILGICLGMQLFSKRSEEGKAKGLSWIDAKTIKFNLSNEFKIPHMGWNTLEMKRNSKLFKGLNNESRFYFVHSYHLICQQEKDIAAITNYGYDFVSVIEKDNIFGVQYHPEKSHKFGMQLLKNFTKL